MQRQQIGAKILLSMLLKMLIKIQKKLQPVLMMWQKYIKKSHLHLVSYSKIMPDIEELMQVWPEEIKDQFQSNQLPGDNIDVGLQEYCQFSCNLLDIPAHSINNNRNIIESLHVLFTLFSEFKTNQHFRQNNDEIQ
ncbi:unnamed protein product [Paramecium primaurelia]|uniref:Intraflagellar transport protein 46 homolog n=1 Tax=Paramecium primaurelia TaxID=5886 RepID=A0A8S1PQ64_PARPR|nr:unnamed protein product [Paramecium primaurelia]CAD8119675.1 unnamed protein product [Paramecium primaurelia]